MRAGNKPTHLKSILKLSSFKKTHVKLKKEKAPHFKGSLWFTLYISHLINSNVSCLFLFSIKHWYLYMTA